MQVGFLLDGFSCRFYLVRLKLKLEWNIVSDKMLEFRIITELWSEKEDKDISSLYIEIQRRIRLTR